MFSYRVSKPCSATNCQKGNFINAFTSIELLGVMTAILVLVTLAFGVSRGVLNQQARTQAKAELAMIAQALEAFKLTYGDYPWISEEADPTTGKANARKLARALTGFAVFEHNNDAVSLEDVTSGGARKGFIETDRLNFNRDFGNPSSASDLVDVFLVDPWGRPYVFVYNKGLSGWDNIGYVLFSKGPDGASSLGSIVSSGVVDLEADVDVDNIYPGE